MEIVFAISAWAAYAPGLSTPQEWRQWASQPHLPTGTEQPALTEMPAMHRRRLGPLGRMAAKVAYDCQGPDVGMPVVFASRYGDATRSLGILTDFSLGEPVSPTDFALSVHNAIGAMVSIARGDGANFTTIAAGAASSAAAVMEAVGLLNDGAPEVLLVCYDAPLPGEYASFADEPAASYAWAWRISQPQAGQARLSLAVSDAAGAAAQDAPELPFGLDVMRFALAPDAAMCRAAGGALWSWRRDA